LLKRGAPFVVLVSRWRPFGVLAGDREGSEAARVLAIVVADGETGPGDADLLAGADLLVAADGGARWLEANGSTPDVIVGDLDSLDRATLERLTGAGSRIDRHPTDKDASDTALAVAAAAEAGADRIVLLGATRGERLDHEIANLLLLAAPAFADRDLRIVRGATQIRGLNGGGTLILEAAAGETVTLVPVGGDAIGITTRGLRYPLSGETLALGSSRGLSNEVEEMPASVRLQIGSLLVIETRTTKEGGQ
jgi:thiamine pyrophosphokinase